MQIWLQLLKKSLMDKLIFCAVLVVLMLNSGQEGVPYEQCSGLPQMPHFQNSAFWLKTETFFQPIHQEIDINFQP